MPHKTFGLVVPTVDITEVFHVGTLNPAHKGTSHKWSYEGAGVSVSEHPEEWSQIAKLGESPTWSLTNPNGTFLDFHSMNNGVRDAINDWALTTGLLHATTMWEVQVTCDETGGYSFLCDTEKEACEEIENTETTTIKKVDVLVATELLTEQTCVPVGTPDVFDLVVSTYAGGRHDINGVWWNDNYDPIRLSCPRGVISPASFPDWRISPAQTS